MFCIAMAGGWLLTELVSIYKSPDSGLFRERNCSNFVLHVAAIMKKYDSPHPINRTGSLEELRRLCSSPPLTKEQIDCSMKSDDLDEIQHCIRRR